LSLPIAKAPPVSSAKSVKSPTPERARTGSIASTGHWTTEQQEDQAVNEEVEGGIKTETGHRRNPSVSVATPFHAYDMSHMSPTGSAPPGWTHIPF
jgi:hypothetical protein